MVAENEGETGMKNGKGAMRGAGRGAGHCYGAVFRESKGDLFEAFGVSGMWIMWEGWGRAMA